MKGLKVNYRRNFDLYLQYNLERMHTLDTARFSTVQVIMVIVMVIIVARKCGRGGVARVVSSVQLQQRDRYGQRGLVRPAPHRPFGADLASCRRGGMEGHSAVQHLSVNAEDKQRQPC
jgi:hypothetical protein